MNFSGLLWVVVDRYEPFCIVSGRCGLLWILFGSLWVVVDHFGSL